MRIAEVSPLFESVPPKLYGGTERVVAYLVDELVRQGEEVTLFASADSVTSAELVSPCRQALRLSGRVGDWVPYHLLLLEQVYRQAERFDIIHFHIEYVQFPVARRERSPHLSTLHGRLDLPDLAPFFQEYRTMPVVSISDSQRVPLPGINWLGTVHHGLPENLYQFRERPERYLAFLGRFSAEKGVQRAVRIAERAGIPLKIAAKVDESKPEYFDQIRPLLENPWVEYVGELGQEEKNKFLGEALALLFPIDWPEPFGLVMIEAMACGTPTIAFRRGSVPEILEDGVSGFVVDNISNAVQAVERVSSIDRRGCRQAFEQRFTANRMALQYLSIFNQVLEEPWRPLQVATQSVS
jgi:glycosyltransferase involved in cell wall biosynthesis